MKIIDYLSNLALPSIIIVTLIFALKEKINIFDTFIEGVKEGLIIIIKIFPTLLGFFVAVGVLRNSGILDIIINILSPFIKIFHIPKEIMPLILLRPISGSASLAVGIDIMKTYGVNSKIGLTAATIMGSTETTIYTIAIYTNYIGVRKTRFVLLAALLGDLVGMLISVAFWGFLS